MRFKLSILLLFILTASSVTAEENAKINYNQYYQFPFSIGVSYQSLSPFSDYGSDFNVYEVYGIFRLPLEKLPSVQPLLQLGIGQYDARNYLDDGDKWDHNQVFGGLGVAYINRFSRDFEVGFDVSGGGALAIFQSRNRGRSNKFQFCCLTSVPYKPAPETAENRQPPK